MATGSQNLTSDKARVLSTTSTTSKFWRGDNTWASICDVVYPVGAIYMSVNSTSPATLFGGTWEQIQDKFLLCAGSSYSAGSTGGAASRSYTPAGSVGNCTLTIAQIPSHAHGLNGHVHSVGAHAHGLNGHAHSVGAHSHGLNSHTHGLNNHAHSVGAHAHGLNSHTHGVGSYANGNDSHSHKQYAIWANGKAYAGSNWAIVNLDAPTSGPATSSYTHKHTISGSSGAASGNTANSSAFNTGGNSGNTAAASGSTANSSAFNTGGNSGSTANSSAFNTGGNSGNTASNGSGGAHNHGFTGTAATIATMPPYLAVYVWKRTA